MICPSVQLRKAFILNSCMDCLCYRCTKYFFMMCQCIYSSYNCSCEAIPPGVERGNKISFTLPWNFILDSCRCKSSYPALCWSRLKFRPCTVALTEGRSCGQTQEFCSFLVSNVILLEFLVPDSQMLFRQSPLGFGFVGMGEKISIAFVLEVMGITSSQSRAHG